MIIKIHFYINGVAISLALKQKLGVTRNGLLIVTTMKRLTSFIKLKSQSPKSTCSQSPAGFYSGQLVFDIIKRERIRVFLLNSTGDRPVAGICLSCEDMVTHI